MPYNYNVYNRNKSNKRNERSDHLPGHRMVFERNKKKILATEEVCAICGNVVDKNLKYPDPMCATVDHIIPVSKGGHPSDISNLQLAHFRCNRLKSNKLISNRPGMVNSEVVNNRDLPLSIDWSRLREGKNQNTLMEEIKQIETTGRHLYADGIR